MNFRTHAEAKRFCDFVKGFTDLEFGSDRSRSLSCNWAKKGLQGKNACMARYLNSKLNHETVPAEYKPRVFENGERIAFPPPTIKVKPPLKHGATPPLLKHADMHLVR